MQYSVFELAYVISYFFWIWSDGTVKHNSFVTKRDTTEF